MFNIWKRAATVIVALVLMTGGACSNQASTAPGSATTAASGPNTTTAGPGSVSTANAPPTTPSSPDSGGSDEGGTASDEGGRGGENGGDTGSGGENGNRSGAGGASGDAETITADEVVRQWDEAAGGSDSLNLCVHDYILANILGPVTKVEAETAIKIGVQECLQDLKEQSEVPVPTIIYPK